MAIRAASNELKGIDLAGLVKNETFLTVVAVFGAILFAFWPFVSILPTKWWFADDTYYAHGAIVPLCAAFIVFDRWDRIKQTPVRAFWPALILLIPVLYLTWVASRTVMVTVLSVTLMSTMLLSVWVVAGGRWLLKLSPAILYLAFGLPLWRSVIDQLTQPLMRLSSDVAYALLKAMMMDPYREQTNIIQLPNYKLNVAEPCSGLKLTLAVVSITVFFMLIARLKLWANLTLAALAVPISIAVNGLRIALIGVVGNWQGQAAGKSFHDTSGYIALVVCFLILYGLTRKLGWK
jgi:exosortase